MLHELVDFFVTFFDSHWSCMVDGQTPSRCGPVAGGCFGRSSARMHETRPSPNPS